jgi:hypothetical protein
MLKKVSRHKQLCKKTSDYKQERDWVYLSRSMSPHYFLSLAFILFLSWATPGNTVNAGAGKSINKGNGLYLGLCHSWQLTIVYVVL